jgi:hypothetical protein
VATRGCAEAVDKGEDPSEELDHLILVVSGPVPTKPKLQTLNFRAAASHVSVLTLRPTS